jgi:hypothetical protein
VAAPATLCSFTCMLQLSSKVPARAAAPVARAALRALQSTRCPVAVLRLACTAVALRDSATFAEVYDVLPPSVKATVDKARAYRRGVAGIRALKELKPSMWAADSAALSISVLRQDAAGKMRVGMFDLLALTAMADHLPKSE